MLHVFIDNGKYCIRVVGQKHVDAYNDYRLFASDIKVRLENEAQIRQAVAAAKENKGAIGVAGASERRKPKG